MGRAIVRQPQVFLMDEPLSNLDAKLRVATRTQIASLQRRLGVTTVYVTHDQVEAMTMGDRVAVLKDGLLQQCDTPRALFERPVNVFVAGFMGSPAMNLIDLPVGADGLALSQTLIPLRAAQRAALTGGVVTIGVRPEGWDLVGAGQGLAATVEVVEELGSDSYAYVTPQLEGGKTLVVRTVDAAAIPMKGDVIGLRPKTASLHLFDTTSGQRLPDSLARLTRIAVPDAVPDLVSLVRRHTTLAAADLDWLHLLVGEWQLLADLSFADLLLWVRAEGAGERGTSRLCRGRTDSPGHRADCLRRRQGRPATRRRQAAIG